jgi:Flp pilus assembly protein TadB
VAPHDEPVLVTTAGISLRDERRARERRYLITMGIRVIAFIVAVVFTTGWIRVVAVILALVLPWIGVVMANAPAKRRGQANPSLYPGEKIHELD